MSDIGHNSKGFTVGQLRGFVERVERLAEEKKAIGEDMKEVFAEAKANGFDTKTIRKVIAERKKEKDARDEEQALFETYWQALEG